MSALALLLALPGVWSLLTTSSLAAVRMKRRVNRAPTRGLSVLKPLCGADPSLEHNLRSFFEQDHPNFELLFGAQRADEPALEVVRRLQREYPDVASRIIVHNFSEGLNPKVRNLRGMLPVARFPLLLISDSNVRAPRQYLSEAAAELEADPTIGLVTHLFAGIGGTTFAAEIEHVQLAGFVAGGAAMPSLVGHAAVIGKSMLMSREHLEAVGGLAGVSDVLAEDYVLGQRLAQHGLRVAIGRTVLQNVVGEMSPRDLVERYARWSMMRRRLCPAAFALEPLASPLLLLPVAFHVLGFSAILWALAIWFVRDVLALSILGRAASPQVLLVSPARDLAMLVAWGIALFTRHVSWRGTRVRVGQGTVLRALATSR